MDSKNYDPVSEWCVDAAWRAQFHCKCHQVETRNEPAVDGDTVCSLAAALRACSGEVNVYVQPWAATQRVSRKDWLLDVRTPARLGFFERKGLWHGKARLIWFVVQHVAAALRHSACTISTLAICHTHFDSRCARLLATALRNNASLKTLRLRNNFVDNAGARALSRALTKNTALQHLNLSANLIGDGGARAFARLLRRNQFLLDLNLNENVGITERGVSCIANVLRRNLSLQNVKPCLCCCVERVYFKSLMERNRVIYDRRRAHAWRCFHVYQTFLLLAHSSQLDGCVRDAHGVAAIILERFAHECLDDVWTGSIRLLCNCFPRV